MKEKLAAKINAAESLEALEQLRVAIFGKKGEIALMMSRLKDLPADQKPQFGQQVNEIRTHLDEIYQARLEVLSKLALEKQLASESIDVSIAAYHFNCGSIHPLNQIIMDLEDFFVGLGYQIAEGPELESDVYNFEMMNLEEGHPARDMQDSFYVDKKHLLRTHTSPVQARSMLAANGADLAIICPGKTYRRDHDDLTHSHQFMQLEGLVIGENVSIANLKDILLKMARHLLGKDKEIRLRPSFFPFTEPSFEVDVSYTKKGGKVEYLEILGAGMVHPNVLKMGGYDPAKVSGFAFGLGIERIAMLKYQIDDIRHFYNNDMRFLKQFKGF